MGFGLAKYDLTELTKRIELPELSPDPTKPLTLIVRYAGIGNRDWENAIFRIAAARKQDDEKKKDGAPPADLPPPPPPADLEAIRRETAEIFAGTVLVGWENVFEDGEPMLFSVEAAQRFLVEMLSRVFDVYALRVRDYVHNIKNFRPSAIDSVELGKG